MRFLLDTNIISELRKGMRANPGVRDWFHPLDDPDLYTSVLVEGELRHGIELKRLRDPTAAAHLERWLATVVTHYSERIIPIDSRVAQLWGQLGVPDPIPIIDGLLAATAIVHDLTLVTRDIDAVRRTGVRVMNPFE